MKVYRCPKCGEVIDINDLIVEEEGGEDDGAVLSAPPPKHISVKTEIDGVVPVTTILYKRVNPLALFLVPFTCLWGGVSMAGIYGSQIMKGEFDLAASLFGLPFLVGTVVLTTFCLFLIFGKYVLTLSGGQGRLFTGIGPIGFKKLFKYGYGTKVTVEEETRRTNRGGSVTTRCMRVAEEGDEKGGVTLCGSFEPEALAYVAAVVRRECLRA